MGFKGKEMPNRPLPFKGKEMPNRPLPPTPPSLPSTNTNSSGNKLVSKSPHTSKEQSINISGGRYEQNGFRNTSYIPFTTSRVNDATIDRMEDNLLRIIQQQEDLMRQRKEIENEILYLRQEYHRNQEVEYNYYGSNDCSCNQMNPYDKNFGVNYSIISVNRRNRKRETSCIHLLHFQTML